MGSAEGFAPPCSLELALALQVGKAECHLLSLPSAGLGQETLPIINLAWEVLGCKDSRQGHHDKFDVSNRHAGLRCHFLCILHHDNELGDAICLHVVLHHIVAQSDHVGGMKPSAAYAKEGHDVDGRDFHVEGVSIFQVIVPNFINNVGEKFGHAFLGHLITCVVIKFGFMGSLCTNANNCCGVVSSPLVVEWETSQAYKFGTIVGFVLDGLGEDGR